MGLGWALLVSLLQSLITRLSHVVCAVFSFFLVICSNAVATDPVCKVCLCDFLSPEDTLGSEAIAGANSRVL